MMLAALVIYRRLLTALKFCEQPFFTPENVYSTLIFKILHQNYGYWWFFASDSQKQAHIELYLGENNQ